MNKKVVVISLGGSLIIPGDVNIKFLREFKKIILRNTRNHKFVIVCGGGSIARKYISALREEKASETLQSFSGISATRMNARFLSYFFNKDPKKGIPEKMDSVRRNLKVSDVVFCGALEYKPKQTSDSTSAEIAKELGTDFINLTNVQGLYDKNPSKFKNAKFISSISWKEFDKMANKLKFQPGQHFVLDQKASEIILRNKIRTYIIGEDPMQLDNLLRNKKFKGTMISG